MIGAPSVLPASQAPPHCCCCCCCCCCWASRAGMSAAAAVAPASPRLAAAAAGAPSTPSAGGSCLECLACTLHDSSISSFCKAGAGRQTGSSCGSLHSLTSGMQGGGTAGPQHCQPATSRPLPSCAVQDQQPTCDWPAHNIWRNALPTAPTFCRRLAHQLHRSSHGGCCCSASGRLRRRVGCTALACGCPDSSAASCSASCGWGGAGHSR